jgi:hypothetical protein
MPYLTSPSHCLFKKRSPLLAKELEFFGEVRVLEITAIVLFCKIFAYLNKKKKDFGAQLGVDLMCGC